MRVPSCCRRLLNISSVPPSASSSLLGGLRNQDMEQSRRTYRRSRRGAFHHTYDQLHGMPTRRHWDLPPRTQTGLETQQWNFRYQLKNRRRNKLPGTRKQSPSLPL
ncbi:uncharacterized protein [Physcomitrium patens]|uniref:uncharacterized protein isoform X1 n=1 Tax=Physcomitrium patens TaxID=3218 RepID=UPI003CCE4291